MTYLKDLTFRYTFLYMIRVLSKVSSLSLSAQADNTWSSYESLFASYLAK